MKKKQKKIYLVLVLLLLAVLIFGGRNPGGAPVDSAPAQTLSLLTPSPVQPGEQAAVPDEDGVYTSAEDLALYLHTYGHLPANFVTKAEARAAGWDGGSLERVLPGKCIGGDVFSNREGLLPAARGRVWRECDVNTLGARSRGAERLLYSSDGLIYYTGDHYESYTLLYGQ